MRTLITLFVPLLLLCNRVSSQKVYGFMTIKEKVVIPAKFERVGYFVNGLAPAKIRGLWGYINTKGEFVIEPKYKYAEDFEYGFARVSHEEPLGFDIPNPLYLNIKGEEFSEDKIFKEPIFMCGLKPNIVNGKYGYINTAGKQVIPATYEYGGKFSRSGIALIVKGGSYGCINKYGKVIVPFVNPLPLIVGNSGYITVANYDNCRIYDSTGAFVVVPNVNDIFGFDKGNVSVFRVDHKYGYINTKGKILVPAEYDEAGSCEEGLAKVKKNKQLFVLDVVNNKIISYVGDGKDFNGFVNGKTISSQNDKLGMIDKNNNIIIPFKYEWLSAPVNDSLIGFAINYEPPPAPIAKEVVVSKAPEINNNNTTTAPVQPATNHQSTSSQSTTTYSSGNISSSSYALDIFSELGSMALYVGNNMYVVKIKGKTIGDQSTVAARAAQVAGVRGNYKYQWFAGKNCVTLKSQYSSVFTIYCNGEIDLNK